MSKNKPDTQKETPKEPEVMPEQADDGAQEAQEAEALDLETLTAQLEAARKQSDEYLGLAQRVQADFENFRRRNNAVRAEAYDDGARAFIQTILPVMDNLERALQAESSDAALKEGVSMVYRQLSEALEKRGVTVDFRDIDADIATLKEFLTLRDTEDVFAPVRARHGVGVPCVIKEDGTLTLDWESVL